MPLRSFLRTLVWLAAVGLAAQSSPQAERALLTHGITGSVRAPGRLNPSAVLDKLPVQRLMLELAQAPREKSYIQAALAGTGVALDDLLTIGLLRAEADRYVINFALFTQADVVRIRRVAEERAHTLAAAYLARQGEIGRLLGPYSAAGGDARAAAYIVLGCFSLDWDGLDLTAEKGYRIEAVERPGIGTFVVWAEERGELTLRGIYWGSHNWESASVALTSFGDHFSLPRQSFPDLLWRVPRAMRSLNAPDAVRDRLADVARDSLDDAAERMGRLMLALRGGSRTTDELGRAVELRPEKTNDLLALLLELQYVRQEGDRYAAAVPVLSKDDQPMVRDLLRLSRGIMADWLVANYEPIREKLGDVTPLRYGVPYKQIFTQVWHYVFGMANRQLVEAGLFADPYATDRRYKGFIPVVFAPGVAESPR